MTKKVRSFIAIELPSQVKLAAGDVQKKLKASGIQLKWVRPENMHLTLRFLGDIEEKQIPEISAAIRTAVGDMMPFSLNAKKIGVFPNMRAPRVIWMGLEGGLDQLMRIYKKLGNELTPLGFPPEPRPFTGHLTLGRVASRISSPILQDAVSAADQTESGMFTVDRIGFIKSDLKPSGAVYTQLAEILFPVNSETTLNKTYRDFNQEES